MQPAAHRIRRQSWTCRASTPGEGFALRERLREAQEVTVPAVFERVFNAACPADKVIHLPRLELRLQLAAVDDLATVLPDLLARALREQLAELLGPAQGAAEQRRSVVSKTARETTEEALTVYLTTGDLPWELAQTETAVLVEQLRVIASENLAAILARGPEESASWLEQIAFFFRLLQVVPEGRRGEVVEGLVARVPLPKIFEVRRALEGSAEMKGAAAEVWWGIAAALTSPPGPLSHLPPSPRERGRLALGLPGEGENLDSRDLSDIQESSAFGQVSPSPGGWVGDGRGGQGVRSRLEAPAMASPGHEPTATAATPPMVIPAARHGVSRPAALPLHIRSAGLVLLHPFLPRLFESAGLLRAGEPGLPWTSLPRAAALLHWLATGREEVLECELGFIKLLLGRRPDEPLLVSDGLLTAADLEEGEALLQAAIGHWRALKSTTPAGLRASFLQRGGLLSEKEHGWHLQVEPVAFDLLLDHLPWGLGVVKLPWMTQPIFTDWPTS